MEIRIPEEFIRLTRGNFIRNLSLGYDEMYLFGVDDLEKEQVGYSIDQEGRSLITDEEGSWQSNWLVIGFNENAGDPFFIDTSSEEFPAYTSMHGEEKWHPTMIADSYVNFIDILMDLQRMSKGRENPAGLEANPISDQEIDEFVSKVEAKNTKSEIWFWDSLFE